MVNSSRTPLSGRQPTDKTGDCSFWSAGWFGLTADSFDRSQRLTYLVFFPWPTRPAVAMGNGDRSLCGRRPHLLLLRPAPRRNGQRRPKSMRQVGVIVQRCGAPGRNGQRRPKSMRRDAVGARPEHQGVAMGNGDRSLCGYLKLGRVGDEIITSQWATETEVYAAWSRCRARSARSRRNGQRRPKSMRHPVEERRGLGAPRRNGQRRPKSMRLQAVPRSDEERGVSQRATETEVYAPPRLWAAFPATVAISIPVGSEIEFIDEATMLESIEGRREV